LTDLPQKLMQLARCILFSEFFSACQFSLKKLGLRRFENINHDGLKLKLF